MDYVIADTIDMQCVIEFNQTLGCLGQRKDWSFGKMETEFQELNTKMRVLYKINI